MKNIIFITASALLTVAVYSCKTAGKAQNNAKFNYDDLYKVWVVDTIIVLGTDVVSTPNIEMDKNEYRFTKERSNFDQGTRTTITSGASFDVSYTIKDGTINFNPAATFPITKFDENGNLVSSNFYATLPPYKIIALSPNKLTLENNDILMKLKAKKY
ncbi:MAG: hypothetical protein KDC85_14085 [Saprospiraceae bacterium]|nr:hypothetical protein [Saprospiraceae bacterium]MCB9323864.1 hypothetical protein [Lewinellaceae bacterium]